MQLLWVPLIVLATYVLSVAWSWLKNYLIASKSGFPTYICPVNPNNPFWMVFSVPLRPMLSRFLPAFVFDHLRYAIYGWEFFDRNTAQAKIGPAFLYVTPGENELWVTDTEIANAILTRRKDFIQLELTRRLMGLFGPNVITSDGDDWQRQRKLIAPVINENISGLVWRESTQQAQQMLEYFMSTNQGETDETIEGLRSIAIHVLGSAGYGVSRPWKEEIQPLQPGHKITFIDGVTALVSGFIVAYLVPAKVLSLAFLPEGLRKLGAAMYEFPTYTKEMLEIERKSAASSPQPRTNFLSTLVKASDGEKTRKEKDSKSSQYLSEEELIGNLFQFTIAGFDTTANTMAYTITTLAAYPEWQDWIIEEIDQVVQSENPVYEEAFPKLSRCLALMHEILRLYAPVSHISRSTASDQTLTTSSGTYNVPANTKVYINTYGVHSDVKSWGSDALIFRPTRWISKGSTDQESLIKMPSGTFLPWSSGPRRCPGIKMSQVEFVAVMATIFREYRVSPMVSEGETMEMAKERLEAVMYDSQPRITMQMNRPQDAKLKWARR